MQVNSWRRLQCWSTSSTSSPSSASSCSFYFRRGVRAKASGPPVRDRTGFRVKPVLVLLLGKTPGIKTPRRHRPPHHDAAAFAFDAAFVAAVTANAAAVNFALTAILAALTVVSSRPPASALMRQSSTPTTPPTMASADLVDGAPSHCRRRHRPRLRACVCPHQPQHFASRATPLTRRPLSCATPLKPQPESCCLL